MPRKRLGRPPSPQETIRSQRVVTFLTRSELAELQQRAVKLDIALSAAAHQILAKELNK